MKALIKIVSLALTLLILSSPTFAGGDKVVSFTTAKNKIYKKIYNNSGETVYCNCDWSNRKTDLSSCGLQSFFPKKQSKRAKRTEMEHIIPASWMLKVGYDYRQCAKDAKALGESSRDYCQKHDINYKQAHNDMVNLKPSVGQINADRSNKPYVDSISGNKKTYGQCPIEIGSRGMVPPANMKGDIARIAYYMSEKYGVTYSKRQMAVFAEWDKKDPVSQEEVDLNKKIFSIQGYGIIN